MTIAFTVTLVFLALVAGYAARQMQEIREKDDRIEEQRAEIERRYGKPTVIEEQQQVIDGLVEENDNLLAENRDLREKNSAHETSLELVLGEMDKTDKPE